jgi:hypothetical protein
MLASSSDLLESAFSPTEQCSQVVGEGDGCPLLSPSATARLWRSSSDVSHEYKSMPSVNSLPECMRRIRLSFN